MVIGVMQVMNWCNWWKGVSSIIILKAENITGNVIWSESKKEAFLLHLRSPNHLTCTKYFCVCSPNQRLRIATPRTKTKRLTNLETRILRNIKCLRSRQSWTWCDAEDRRSRQPCPSNCCAASPSQPWSASPRWSCSCAGCHCTNNEESGCKKGWKRGINH